MSVELPALIPSLVPKLPAFERRGRLQFTGFALEPGGVCCGSLVIRAATPPIAP